MATHNLPIAKASLLAACLRPDCTKLNRDDLTIFHNLLETSISRCTPTNIQKTKSWLLQHILPSSLRTTALSKYLVNLSKNITSLPPVDGFPQPRTCRQRLHVLYLINDIFYHVNHYSSDTAIQQHVRECFSTALPELFANTVVEKRKKTTKRLQELIQIWEAERYLEQITFDALRDALNSETPIHTKIEQSLDTRTTKELPWIMPATHGDPAAPFFDLPAANLMPHIVPNVSKPIRPDHVRALQLTAGPADESLVNAMKDFLKDVSSIDQPFASLEDEGIVPEIDEMGQVSYKNEADDVVGDTYYGWSRAFCEKMKKRSKGIDSDGDGDDRGRSRSSQSSRGSSRSPKKRRRYSSSMSRSRSRSRSASRSMYPARGQQGHNPKPHMSNPPYRPQPEAYPSAPPRFHPRQDNYGQGVSQPPAASGALSSASVPPFQPPPYIHNSGPGGSPPPRPPNWQGPWPPLPPPPSGPGSFAGSFTPNMPFPPPPPHNFNQSGYGSR